MFDTPGLGTRTCAGRVPWTTRPKAVPPCGGSCSRSA